jgi:hypothetical protein
MRALAVNPRSGRPAGYRSIPLRGRRRSRYNCAAESVESQALSIADGQPPNIPSRRETEHLAALPLAGEA